jgi:hypothetical protein
MDLCRDMTSGGDGTSGGSGHLIPASTEATKKRKIDACVGPAGKWVKVPEKKRVATSRVTAMSKSVGAASSKTASAPPKVVPNAGVPPRVVAPKTARMKSVSHASPSIVSVAVMTKVVHAERQGALGAANAGVL